MPGLKHQRGGEVRINLDGVELGGSLEIPEGAVAVVLFAHGSGSGRLSERNQHVARLLREGGLGTLLFDLLTEEEASDRINVFDIPLLARRLSGASDWLRGSWGNDGLRLGYFGASTGAGAALMAAAKDPSIGAVVSRGGRPDLAGPSLARVDAPTLLIVGGADPGVLELNQQALVEMRCIRDLRVIPGAGHLFEQPGALDEVARLALNWFSRYLAG